MQFEALRNLATSMRIYQRNRTGKKFEPEVRFMQYAIGPGDTCLHFGGSDGRHSFVMSKLVGAAGRVHVYEPSSYSFAILERLVRWHGLSNVTAHRAAIGAREGSMILSAPRKRSGHIGRAYGVVSDAGRRSSEQDLAEANDTQFEQEETPVVSLDGIMSAEALERVDFIRCDVEGAEIRMIEGGRDTLERDLPNLLIEIHPFSLQQNFDSSAEDVRSFFRSLGYRFWQLADDDHTMFESDEIDQSRRWKDYFLIHPSRADKLPDGMFRTAFASKV